MKKTNYEVLTSGSEKIIKSWTRGVPFEEEAKRQLQNIAELPFIYKWIAAMPDVHLGKGATIGSVIPTTKAVIPSAVGVDIGCGMMAVKTSILAKDLPDSLSDIRSSIESVVPVGRAGHNKLPKTVEAQWAGLAETYNGIIERHPLAAAKKREVQLGTLGGGNHFIELCLDESNSLWVMLHSGSRGLGNRIGNYFISLAKKDMEKWMIQLPDKDLAYFPCGTEHFKEYMVAVHWAQEFARINREIMMKHILEVLLKSFPFMKAEKQAINCHHNYVEIENHYGKNVYITRKGAVRARKGDLGIIPGSMGAKSYIVRGLGNEESFHSCSHGAGRVMSRTKAKQLISLEEHRKDTKGVECRKDKGVLDESPKAYKDIDKVMEAQKDLVEILHTLKQIVCVKG